MFKGVAKGISVLRSSQTDRQNGSVVVETAAIIGLILFCCLGLFDLTCMMWQSWNLSDTLETGYRVAASTAIEQQAFIPVYNTAPGQANPIPAPTTISYDTTEIRQQVEDLVKARYGSLDGVTVNVEVEGSTQEIESDPSNLPNLEISITRSIRTFIIPARTVTTKLVGSALT